MSLKQICSRALRIGRPNFDPFSRSSSAMRITSKLKCTASNPIETRYFHAQSVSRRQANYRRFGENNSFNNSSFRAGFGGSLVAVVLNNPRLRNLLIFFLGGTAVLVVTHIEPAPVSGRRRLLLFGPWLENKFGQQQYEQLLSQYRGRILPESAPDAVRVSRVMKRLIKVAGMSDDIDWKIHVIVDPKTPPNAFVLPGGKVFVFSSILPLCANDDQLATVLSHETAHQLARHSGENMSRAPFAMLASIAAYLLTGSSSLTDIIVTFVFQRPRSRQMESEADYIGLLMMSQACFDPRQAIPFWNHMENLGGMKPAEFLSTHPSDETRIRQIQQWMPKALQIRNASECHSTEGFINELHNSFSSAFFYDPNPPQ
ncbi:peptidase family M48-domain-containing protein [Lipomyces oligophaga]|uniref:peptidase family M48-domain-containing protein n=1 Tax=Lipomyces oligophaga TaxID=45792 RepID=UPI0034CE6DDF